jgi:hypothetical protein
MGMKYIKEPEVRTPAMVKATSAEFLDIPRLFSAKSMVTLALLYWLIYLVPVYGESLEMGVTIVWFGSIILLAMKRAYPGLLLALLSAYNFVYDLIVELPKFDSKAIHVANVQNITESTALISLFILLMLEVVFLGCFIYYALNILPSRRRYPF